MFVAGREAFDLPNILEGVKSRFTQRVLVVQLCKEVSIALKNSWVLRIAIECNSFQSAIRLYYLKFEAFT